MAEPNKVEIYRLLFRVNRAFAFVVEHLGELEPMRVIAPKSVRNFKGYTQELQAEINQELLEALHQTELDDWGRFGKIKQAREKELSDPDDVFIKAEERRQQLKKQKRKQK